MVRLHNHQSLFYKVFKEKLLSNGTSDGGKDEFKSILCLEEHSKRDRDVIKRGKTYCKHFVVHTFTHT